MKYRVIELISTLGDGGAEALVKDYAIMLNKLNVQTDILTMYKVTGSSNMAQAQKAGVCVESIFPGHTRTIRLIKQTLGVFFIPLLLLRIIKCRNITCLHVHMNQLHHVAPIMRFIKGVNVLYTCHNDPDKYFRGISGRMEFNAVKKLVGYKNFTLIALHDTMAEELEKMFATNKIEVIRNGVDFNKYKGLGITRVDKRRELGIDNNAFVVGHVGRFSPQKNHSFLVDVFADIANKNDKAFLLLVGSGQLENEMIEKLHKLNLDGRYKILSHRTDIPELLNIMDVYLFPSLYEGLPVSLVEAQVSKLHCVVSDKINEAAFLLPSTTVLSLNDPITEWSNECLKKYEKIEWNDKLLGYDMNREILRLKKMMIG